MSGLGFRVGLGFWYRVRFRFFFIELANGNNNSGANQPRSWPFSRVRDPPIGHTVLRQVQRSGIGATSSFRKQ